MSVALLGEIIAFSCEKEPLSEELVLKTDGMALVLQAYLGFCSPAHNSRIVSLLRNTLLLKQGEGDEMTLMALMTAWVGEQKEGRKGEGTTSMVVVTDYKLMASCQAWNTLHHCLLSLYTLLRIQFHDCSEQCISVINSRAARIISSQSPWLLPALALISS